MGFFSSFSCFRHIQEPCEVHASQEHKQTWDPYRLQKFLLPLLAQKSHTTAGKLGPCLEICIPIESLNLGKTSVDHVLFSLAKHKANFGNRQGCLWHCNECGPQLTFS